MLAPTSLGAARKGRDCGKRHQVAGGVIERLRRQRFRLARASGLRFGVIEAASPAHTAKAVKLYSRDILGHFLTKRDSIFSVRFMGGTSARLISRSCLAPPPSHRNERWCVYSFSGEEIFLELRAGAFQFIHPSL